MLTYWLLFIVLFGVVVFIHELGHFTLAKLSGVFVERFALGFGPALVKKTIGETEYAICAFPLGGYVKMRGEDPTETDAPPDPRSFSQARLRNRIAIVMMGPFANLLLPVILFTGLFMIGLPTMTSRVGMVLPDSPAEKAGLRSGDRISAIDGEPIWKWAAMERIVQESAGKSLRLSVDRAGRTTELTVVPETDVQPNLFGEEQPVGRIGISPQPLRPTIGVADPKSPAALAGLATGDTVVSVNGAAVDHWWQLIEAFKTRSEPKTLVVENDASKKKTAVLPAGIASLAAAGIDRGELFIREVVKGSVAEAKGIRPGDKLVAVNGTPIERWPAFQEKILRSGNEALNVRILRGGEALDLEVSPKIIEEKNELTKQKEQRPQLGVVSAVRPGEIEERAERHLNPFVALARSAQTSGELIGLTVTGLYKLFTGKLSVKKSLGGPISIFYLAGSSYEAGGWMSFLRMMALLSITLGIINFLPIPILDGGHLLFFLIEGIKGSPVNVKVREWAQQVGLLIILGLMLLTFYVDIERYFFDRIKQLFN